MMRTTFVATLILCIATAQKLEAFDAAPDRKQTASPMLPVTGVCIHKKSDGIMFIGDLPNELKVVAFLLTTKTGDSKTHDPICYKVHTKSGEREPISTSHFSELTKRYEEEQEKLKNSAAAPSR